LLGCGALYVGLVAPLFVTCQLPAALSPVVNKIMYGLIGTTWFGYILAALGDLNKTVVKAIRGDDHLVTTGIFRWLRHPNYTGEIVAWTASSLAAVVGAVALADTAGVVSNAKLISWVFASLFGVVGIDFVLAAATNNLEKKQKEKYGDSPAYKDWMDNSWSGFMFKNVEEEDSHETPHLELSPDAKEGSGSGI
jgi:protein-S-isoprenylcysteine O-methyltransferase Ste14